MKQDYFIHDDVTYYRGTQIKLLDYPYDNPVLHDLVYFVCYDTDYDVVTYQMAYSGQRRGCSMNAFLKMFGGTTGKIDKSIQIQQKRHIVDSKNPKLINELALYIVIMLFFTFTTMREIGWIITSLFFLPRLKTKD